MVKSLYVFNPENDLALADGSFNYTAPKHALKLKRDLQMLPVWYADSGSVLLADISRINCEFLDNVKRNFHCANNLSIFKAEGNVDVINPWGWSPAICYQLKQYIGNAPVPDDECIDTFRNVSHRRTSIKILAALGYNDVLPKECFSIDELESFLRINGECIIKAPWSSSGKGVFYISETSMEAYRPLIGGFIKKQGSIICEKYLDKVLDFAMEFKSGNGNLSFVGLSVFDNNNRFSYERAVVGSYEVLLQKIVKYVSFEEIIKLQKKIVEVLSNIIPYRYNGYFGVDMMVFKDKGDYRIMPCVELNLRTTMGLVASVIGEKVVGENKEGQMSVLYHKSINELNEFLRHTKSPIIKDGRLYGGSLMLVPIYPDSCFTAMVEIID